MTILNGLLRKRGEIAFLQKFPNAFVAYSLDRVSPYPTATNRSRASSDGDEFNLGKNDYWPNRVPAVLSGETTATVSRFIDQVVPTGRCDISMGNSATSYIDAGVALGTFSTFRQTVRFRTNNNGAIQTMADSRDAGGDGVNMGIDSRASSGADQGKLFFNCNTVTIYSANVYHDDNIYMAVGEYDGSTIYLTVYDEDGVQLEQQTSAFSGTFNVTNNTIIGSRAFSTKTNPWSKYFGMVKIETDGSTVFEYDFNNINGATVPDISGNGNNGTIVGSDIKRANMKLDIVAKDRVQTTVADQRLLISSGQLVQSGGLPAIEGNADIGGVSSDIVLTGAFSLYAVLEMTGADEALWAKDADNYIRYIDATEQLEFRFAGGVATTLDLDSGLDAANRYLLEVYRSVANLITVVINGVAQTNTITLAGTFTISNFGDRASTDDFDGKLQEDIIFSSNLLTTDAPKVRQDIKTRWKVY